MEKRCDETGALTPASTRFPRALTTVAVLGSAFVMAAVVAVGWSNWKSVQARTDDFTRSNAFFLAEHAARLLQGSDTALQKTVQEVSGRDWDVVGSSSVHRELAELASTVPYVDGIWVYDRDARLRANSYAWPTPTVDARNSRVFAKVMATTGPDGIVVGTPQLGRLTGRNVFATARPIPDAQGRAVGVAMVTLSPTYFYDFWSKMTLPKGASVTLFREDDQEVLARYPLRGDEDFGFDQRLDTIMDAAPTSSDFVMESPDGTKSMQGSYSKVDGLPLYVRVSLPRSAMVRAWINSTIVPASFAAVSLIAFLGLLGLARRQSLTEAGRSRELRSEVLRQTSFLTERTRFLESMVGLSMRLGGSMDPVLVRSMLVDAGAAALGGAVGTFVVDGRGVDRVLIRDAASEQPPADLRLCIEAGNRSLVAVPVVARDGRSQGTLAFAAAEPGRFDERHVLLLEALASIAAVALDNARMFEETQREIEARRRTEAMQKALVRESHHRIKNNLATIKALANISARTATGYEAFLTSFSSRLTALGQTHTLLTDADRQAASIADLVETELRHYDDGSRFDVRGPRVLLVSEQAVSLGMAIHELATNAVKYGGLSTETGRVRVRWSLHDGNEGRTVSFEWLESGGPPISVPTRRGFGSTLLDRILPSQLGARIENELAAGGLSFRIEFPLSRDAG